MHTIIHMAHQTCIAVRTKPNCTIMNWHETPTLDSGCLPRLARRPVGWNARQTKLSSEREAGAVRIEAGGRERYGARAQLPRSADRSRTSMAS
eukprot:5824890-Prymnesium_polylepis.1